MHFYIVHAVFCFILNLSAAHRHTHASSGSYSRIYTCFKRARFFFLFIHLTLFILICVYECVCGVWCFILILLLMLARLRSFSRPCTKEMAVLSTKYKMRRKQNEKKKHFPNKWKKHCDASRFSACATLVVDAFYVFHTSTAFCGSIWSLNKMKKRVNSKIVARKERILREKHVY